MTGTRQEPGDLLPRPDPTLLTTAQLQREIASVRNELDVRLEALAQVDEERIRHLERVLEERTVRFAESFDTHARHVRDRFEERDLRFNERDADRQDAVETALTAAKALFEARDGFAEKTSDKFEQAIKEQLGQLSSLAAANRDLLDGKIDALRQRIDRAEAATDALANQRSDSERQAAMRITLAAVGISAVVIVVNIILYILSHR